MTKPMILVADDMPLNFFAIEDLLERAGYLPVLATNGKQAVEKFLAADYLLVLMDLRMPVMDGLDATRWIRRHEQAANPARRTPIIMLSASMDDRQAAQEAGCDDYLVKPLERTLLLGTLGKYLGAIHVTEAFTPVVPGIRQPTAHYLIPGIR